jgi:hypothetical protein
MLSKGHRISHSGSGGTPMADPEHVAIVLAGKKAIAEWRAAENPRTFSEGFDLSGKWRHDNLSELDLRWSNFADADLTFGKLRGANLSGSDFRNAKLTGADLRGANLTGSKFEGAVMWHADLEGADLTDVKGLALSESNIRNARFSPNADDDWSQLHGCAPVVSCAADADILSSIRSENVLLGCGEQSAGSCADAL